MKAALAVGLRMAAAATALQAASVAKAQQAAWHPPRSLDERALDAILKQDNLSGGRGQPGFRQTVDYGAVLTQPLRRALAAKEASLVRAECGGRYRDGALCGMDYSPLTCAQDSSVTYLYRTEGRSGRSTMIGHAWPGRAGSPVATHRVVRSHGALKIDGIACEPATRFNW